MKVKCVKNYESSFFNLVSCHSYAKKGDECTIISEDNTFITLKNHQTGIKFYLPKCVFENFFMVEGEDTNENK